MAVFQIKPEHHFITVKVAGAVGTAVGIACATSFTFEESQATEEIRCLGVVGSAASPEASGYSFTASIDGVYKFFTGADVATNTGLQNFRTWMQAGQVLEFVKTTNVTGGSKITFLGLITGLTENAPSEGVATYSVSVTGSGLPITSPIV